MSKTILILLFAVAFRTGIFAQTFTEHIDIQCGDTAFVGNLGYPSWNAPEITHFPQYGHALLLGDFIAANLLQYQAPFYYTGTDTVAIKCAKATQITCDTGIYVFHVGCNTVYDPVFPIVVGCNDTAIIYGLNGFAVPYIAQQAQHGVATIIPGATDAATLVYIPDPGFVGLDNVLVSLFFGQDTVNYLFQVYCKGVNGTTSAQEIRPIRFFPQPVSGQAFADGITGEVSFVKVMDISGRTVEVLYKSEQGRVILEVSSLVAGIYVVEIKTGPGRIWIGKLVK